MKKEKIEVYSKHTNNNVIKMTGRKFPGLVIQGDSLSILYSQAMTIVEKLESHRNKELFLEALSLAESLENFLKNYSDTLKNNNIELPFIQDFGRTTESYKHHWNE